jgi:hypothetical protein
MKLSWLKGAKTPEAKKERQALIQAAKPALKILKEILEDELNNLEDNELKSDVYNTSNWAYLQADINGAKRTYRKVIDLLPIKESK